MPCASLFYPRANADLLSYASNLLFRASIVFSRFLMMLMRKVKSWFDSTLLPWVDMNITVDAAVVGDGVDVGDDDKPIEDIIWLT